MRRFLIGIFLCATVHALFGQTAGTDSTIVAKDSVVQEEKPKKAPPKFEYGVYGESAIRLTPAFGNYRLTSSFGIGGQFEFASVGFNAYKMQSNIYSTLIFPNEFSLHSQHGSIYLGLRVINTRFVNSEIKCNIGKGDVVWRRESNDEDFLRDEFNLLEPEITVTAVPIKYIRMYISAGYRRIRGLEIAKVTNEDISGFTFGLGLKIGFYSE